MGALGRTSGMPLVSGVKRMMKRLIKQTHAAKKRKMPNCEAHITHFSNDEFAPVPGLLALGSAFGDQKHSLRHRIEMLPERGVSDSKMSWQDIQYVHSVRTFMVHIMLRKAWPITKVIRKLMKVVML